MTTANLFAGSITIKVKSGTKKFTWAHEFTPQDLSFQETLVPIFLKDITIPEHERMFLTKDLRKIMLQVRNIKSSAWMQVTNEIKAFIKDNADKEMKVEAHGVGAFIVSQALKNTTATISFHSYEFPFALLDRSFQKKLMKKPNTCHLFYSKDSPFKMITSILGPKFKWSKGTKVLVA